MAEYVHFDSIMLPELWNKQYTYDFILYPQNKFTWVWRDTRITVYFSISYQKQPQGPMIGTWLSTHAQDTIPSYTDTEMNRRVKKKVRHILQSVKEW